MTQKPQLRALGATLGTEILGIDLSKPLEADTFAGIQAAFAEHPVLVFRDQDLGAPELAAFGRRFGAPRPHALIKYRHVDCPEVSWLTNVEETGEVDWYGVKRATAWHTDSTFEDALPLLAMLHAKEVPSEEGGHMFADMRAAYDRWRVGDVLIWDERATMHRGAGDYRPDERRIMLRTIVYPN